MQHATGISFPMAAMAEQLCVSDSVHFRPKKIKQLKNTYSIHIDMYETGETYNKYPNIQQIDKRKREKMQSLSCAHTLWQGAFIYSAERLQGWD